jgi:hypothetical protein
VSCRFASTSETNQRQHQEGVGTVNPQAPESLLADTDHQGEKTQRKGEAKATWQRQAAGSLFNPSGREQICLDKCDHFVIHTIGGLFTYLFQAINQKPFDSVRFDECKQDWTKKNDHCNKAVA